MSSSIITRKILSSFDPWGSSRIKRWLYNPNSARKPHTD